MRVRDLEGALLDYWVAQIERTAGVLVILRDGACFLDGGGKQRLFAPSLDWAHGGPIIERERIGVDYCGYNTWKAVLTEENGLIVGAAMPLVMHGDTALVAAMRAYVASKFGDEVRDMADAQPGSAG